MRRAAPWIAALLCLGIAAVAALAFADRPTIEAPESAGRHGPRAVVRTLAHIERTQRFGRYRHATRVDAARGRFEWDCSGMANWVLHRTAPRAFRSLHRGRPVARTYARALDAATTTGRGPWQRVTLPDAQPGDVLAWELPRAWPSDLTGHVVFLVEPPSRVPWSPALYRARIADSTSIPHLLDTRQPGESGFGTGEMTFTLDAAGDIIAWGWLGLGGPLLPGHVSVGRPLR